MSVNQELLNVALNSLSLFRAPGSSPALIQAVAEVTGIPMFLLLNAEQRVMNTRSMGPLKQLFRNPAVPKADGLQYSMKVKQMHLGRLSSRQRVATRMTLAIATIRGKIVITATLTISTVTGQFAQQAPRVARLAICYRVESQGINQAYRQEMTIAAPGNGQQAKVVNIRARAA